MFHIWIQKSYDEIISFEKHSIIDEPCLFHWVGLHQSKYVKPTSRSYRWASIQSFSKLVNAKFFEQIFEQALDYSWRTTSQIINVSTLKVWINHIEIIQSFMMRHIADHQLRSYRWASIQSFMMHHIADHQLRSYHWAIIQSFMMHHIADHQHLCSLVLCIKLWKYHEFGHIDMELWVGDVTRWKLCAVMDWNGDRCNVKSVGCDIGVSWLAKWNRSTEH